MLSLPFVATTTFAPAAVPVQSRPAVRCDAPVMTEESSSRRELFARAGAAVFAASAVQGASAKAGQFSKLDIFSVVGEPAISSPYQVGGPKGSTISGIEKGETTYGYTKSDGPILADGFRDDVTREKAAYEVSAKIVRSQQKNIDSKTWWLVRDNLRGQAYNMKENMLAINSVLAPAASAKAAKAYKTFWNEINQLDLACVKKELDLANKEYGEVLAALKAYEEIIA